MQLLTLLELNYNVLYDCSFSWLEKGWDFLLFSCKMGIPSHLYVVLVSLSLGLNWPTYMAYFSSLCSLSFCSINPSSATSVMPSSFQVVPIAPSSSGGISVVETASPFSSGLSVFIIKFWKGNVSTKSNLCLSISDLGILKLSKVFCPLALALLPSQSSPDQSNWTSKGCGACCLQKEHVAPKCSHDFWGMGFMRLILLVPIRFVPKVSNLFVLIGLKWWLWLDHQVLTFPGACFLGFWGGFVGVEIWGVHVKVFCLLLSSLNALIFFLREGKGHTFTPQSKNGGLYCMLLLISVYLLHSPDSQIYIYHIWW